MQTIPVCFVDFRFYSSQELSLQHSRLIVTPTIFMNTRISHFCSLRKLNMTSAPLASQQPLMDTTHQFSEQGKIPGLSPLLVLLTSLRIWNPIISSPLQPRLPLTITCLINSTLLVSSRLSKAFALVLPKPMLKYYSKHPAEICWIAWFLLVLPLQQCFK